MGLREPPRPPRLSESDGGQEMNVNKHKYKVEDQKVRVTWQWLPVEQE